MKKDDISLIGGMRLFKGIIGIVDYVAIVVALWSAYYLRLYLWWDPVADNYEMSNYFLGLALPGIFLMTLILNEAYEVEIPYYEKVKRVVRALTIGSIISLFFMYLGNGSIALSRIFFVAMWIFSTIGVLVARYVTERSLDSFHIFNNPVLLIGAGKTAELVDRDYIRMRTMRYRIMGYVDDNPKSESIKEKYPCLGSFDSVEDIIKQYGIDTVIVCAPGMESKALVNLVNRLQLLVRRVAFVPEIFGLPVANVTVRGMMEEQGLIIRVQNNLAHPMQRMVKRVFDVIATSIGGLIISPVLAVVALLIYLDSPGPIVFAHTRIGRGGKEFPCYKFRTMVPNAQEVLQTYLQENPEAREEWERDFKLRNDPRITKIGKFLRKTSLDELPQLWNVIMGHMSLVGPRPIIEDEIKKYGTYIEDFYLVRPGITGVWQVSGRNDTTYEERVQMDSWYVRNWTIWLDIVYLVKTVMVVVKGKGAY